MSEYQYYEFQAIDRPLSETEMGELRALSTRADITPTSFTNTYHYGDFRGKPHLLMEKYFDAFVYVANWGTRRTMLRLPRSPFDVEAATPYCPGESAKLWTKGEYVVVEFRAEEEGGGDWEAGEGWLSALVPLRSELLAGDLRSLYLGWLLCAESGDLEDDDVEPPVPPGLGQLSKPQRSLAEFLRLDPQLIAVAAEASADAAPAGSTRDELTAWIASLPEAEKNALLLRLVEEETPRLRYELLQRCRQATKARAGTAATPTTPRRTVAQLLDARDNYSEAERRRETERKAKERARHDREQARARAEYLDGLAKREAETWREVETLIATKQPKHYDQAVALLKDLRDLGERSGRKGEVLTRLRELRERHSSKSSLKRRLDQAGLTT